jgi:hypothetical protein
MVKAFTAGNIRTTLLCGALDMLKREFMLGSLNRLKGNHFFYLKLWRMEV